MSELKEIKGAVKDSLEIEAKGRFLIAKNLSAHIRDPGIPIPVRILVADVLLGLLSYSVLITLFTVNTIYAVITKQPFPGDIYAILFGIITLFVFISLFLFGRSAMEYEILSRTQDSFTRAARSRIRRTVKK